MKLITVLFISLGLTSCLQKQRSDIHSVKTSNNRQDTIITKHKLPLNKKWDADFYSMGYVYYWLVGKDTLDFSISITEWEKDGSLHIDMRNNQSILFSSAVNKINECVSLIQEDFDISKLSSLYFDPPIYYFDLAQALSREYEQEFGQKNIPVDKQVQFLLKSSYLNAQLNNFLVPLHKKVKHYGIEKFHLIDRKHLGEYLTGVDFTKYPEVTIGGMGISVKLE